MIALWNTLKAGWSLFNDVVMLGERRVPVPLLASPQAAADYMLARCVYTGDPGSGAFDFYLRPQRLQAAMEQGPAAVRRLAVDCDDYATWFYAALIQMKGVTPQIYTLKDASGRWGHHVVCAYHQITPTGPVWGVLDTNGHHALRDSSPAGLCALFTGLYSAAGGPGYHYTEAVLTPYPF